jgi:hypothetical protein
VSLVCIAVTFLWGWVRGGSPYHAYYQLWRFLTALLVGYLLVSVIRTPRDLWILAITIIFAALIRGTLVMYFYWVHVHGRINPRPEYMTSHDDSLLFVTAVLIAGSWAALKRGRAAWITAALVSLYLFYAMVLNDRRIAWVELATAIIAIYFLIGEGPLRRRFTRWVIVALPLAFFAFAVVGGGGKLRGCSRRAAAMTRHPSEGKKKYVTSFTQCLSAAIRCWARAGVYHTRR